VNPAGAMEMTAGMRGLLMVERLDDVHLVQNRIDWARNIMACATGAGLPSNSARIVANARRFNIEGRRDIIAEISSDNRSLTIRPNIGFCNLVTLATFEVRPGGPNQPELIFFNDRQIGTVHQEGGRRRAIFTDPSALPQWRRR
jgi:hypothetical protein